MPYQIGWLVENRVILMTFTDKLITEDVFAIDKEVIRLFESSPESKVYTLADLTRNTSLPPLANLMNKLQSPKHPKYAFAITYGYSNSLVRTILLVLVSIFRMKYRNLRTREEALRFLRTIEPTLSLPDEAVT